MVSWADRWKIEPVAKFFGGDESVVGRDFFQAIHFSYPEAVQKLIDGAGGVEPQSMVRLGDQLLATEVRVQLKAKFPNLFKSQR